MSEQDAMSDGLEFAGEAEDAAMAVVTKPAPPRRKPRKLPPYKVLLHNDDVNDIVFVIRSILRLTRLTPEEALERTLEAHETGVALLLVTHKERAELYCEQFTSLKLTVTIERDSE